MQQQQQSFDNHVASIHRREMKKDLFRTLVKAAVLAAFIAFLHYT